MLFSVYNLNGSGYITRAELFIGMRTLYKGLSHFFTGFVGPSSEEIEGCLESLFVTIGAKDFISLGEALTFAYRDRTFRQLTDPFPSKDEVICEDMVHFEEVESSAPKEARSEEQLERCVRERIRLSPDPADWRPSRPRARPIVKKDWVPPANITRMHAWLMWRFFKELAGGNRIITVDHLRTVVCDEFRVAAVLKAAQEQRGDWVDAPGVVTTLAMQRFCLQASGGHLRDRLEDLAAHSTVGISLRGLCSMVWPHVREADVEILLGWCKAYQARSVLKELMRRMQEEVPDIDAEDIEALFDTLDGNRDGQQTVEELGRSGHNELICSSRRLLDRLLSQPNTSLSKAEVRSVVFNMDHTLKAQFQLVHAAETSARTPVTSPRGLRLEPGGALDETCSSLSSTKGGPSSPPSPRPVLGFSNARSRVTTM